MAYYLTYTLQFNNKITENILIELYQKDVNPSEVKKLITTSCEKKYLSGNSDGFDTILSAELDFSIYINVDSTLSYENFLVSFHDQWKVIMYNDSQIDFVGFITPAEGGSNLKAPYEIDIVATDNLGLLKTPLLKKIDGSLFEGYNSLLTYLSAILYQTNLNLNIRTYGNIYESSMPDRITDSNSDFFNNTKLEARSFQSDPITFLNCYDALSFILDGAFFIYQHNGRWVIMRQGEFQTGVGPKNWYTEFDYSGNVVGSAQELFEAAFIAKEQILHMQAADQKISAEFALKYAKHTFNYNTWPELPKNSKFEYGGQILGETGTNPDGTTWKKFVIDDWQYGKTNPSSPSTFPPTMGSPVPDIAYRLSTYNAFGVEISREIVLAAGSAGQHRFLMSEGLPVRTGGIMEIGFDFKLSRSGTGTMDYAFIFLIPDAGGLPYRLENDNPIDGGAPFRWVRTGALRFVSKFYSSENWQDYSSLQVTTPAMPEDGTFYICFMNYDPPANTQSYYRNFTLTYHPYIAGGYVQVKGDSWNTTQDTNYLDNIDTTVQISDSPEKLFMGALIRNDGINLTTSTWHRFNRVENKGFKELLNLVRYNFAYRRMWRIAGTFGGTKFHPYNNQTIEMPLALHKHYFFRDNAKLANKYFQLLPPLSIDYVNGNFSGVFREVLDTTLNDGEQEGNLHEFKYNFT